MNLFRRKRRFPALVMAAVMLLFTWDVPVEAEETEAVETEEMAEAEETVSYGSPENGEDYDFSGIAPLYEEAETADRYFGFAEENVFRAREITRRTDLAVHIRKRAEWTDQDTGDGEITLQYASNSGLVTGTKDMNIILLQDKSGSMDSNYGFRIQLEYEGLSASAYQSSEYYPIRNPYGWTEAADEMVDEIVENRNYVGNLNYTGEGFNGGYIHNGEMAYNSPCQVDAHYYLLAADDATSGNTKSTFIHGNNLYNISGTDYHHYRLLSSREEALGYLAAGRRVIRAKKYCDENGELHFADEYYYFLDISKIVTYHGKQYLSTIDTECEKNDRLSKSQDFMKKLTENMKNLNKNNQIAYIPFWGDVPQNGSWRNLSANGSNNGLIVDTYSPQISTKAGVGTYGFQPESKFGVILEQIQNPFTYNGTNWSAAFNQALVYLKQRNNLEKEKDTLLIFLTDGMPQGFAGKASDIHNPAINGQNQIKELKGLDGVRIYACGVCINQQDQTVTDRMNQVDSSGAATFARTTNQFNELMEAVEERIQEEYEEAIYGKDGFYMDQLSDEVSLDEKKLDSSWSVLEKEDAALVKGVPENVYREVADHPQVTHVYVRKTKTVYWYVKEMTNGSYDAEGHTFSFPVTYMGYDDSTAGNKKNIQTNQKQKFTYISSANENQVLEVATEVPNLVFSRQNPSISIEKKLEGSDFKKDQTFYFSCADTRQSYAVKDAVKTASVTVKAGETVGRTIINDMKPGTYYIYETDKEGKIISPEEKCVSMGQKKEIMTLEKNSEVPASATASDGSLLENRNNYLQISAVDAAVSFTNSYTSVIGEKMWDDGGSSKRPSKVVINLYCDGKKADSAEVSEKTGWKFGFNNLSVYDSQGKEHEYTVEEEPVDWYRTFVQYENRSGGKYAIITNRLEAGDLTVTKTIKSGEEDIWWAHGNPTFVIRVSGDGADGEHCTFYHTYEFTREYVQEHQKDGVVSLSYTFKDIPLSGQYKVEELCVSRYAPGWVKGNGENVTLREDTAGEEEGVFSKYAEVNLKERPEGTEVEFFNDKKNYGWYSHNAFVENQIHLQ